MTRALLMCAVCMLGACDKKSTNDKPSVIATASAATPIRTIDAGTTPLEVVEVPEVRVRKNAVTTVRVTWVTPKDTAVNDGAPFRVTWNRSEGLADAPPDVKSTGSAVKDGFSVKVQPMSSAPNASLTGEIDIVVCDSATHSVCLPVRRTVELGFTVAPDANAETNVKIPLPEARLSH